MIYQICPICDQKLTKRNYCSHCHQRIKKPLTINVDYYLNERHPDTAHDCTYHDTPMQKQGSYTVNTGSAVPNKPRKTVPSAAPNRSAGSSNPTKTAAILIIIFAALILCFFYFGILANIFGILI